MCLEIVAEKGTKKAMVDLRANIKETEEWLREGSLPNFTQTSFHIHLARATGNPLLETFMTTLMTLITGFFGKGDPDIDFSFKDLETHKMILNAIEQKDLQNAKALLKAHILDSKAFVGRVMGETGNKG